MAKKKKHPSQLRYGTVTPDQIGESVEKLEMLVGAMKEVAQEMQSQSMAELRMDGVTKFDRSYEILSGYVEHLVIAMTKSKFK